MENAKTPSKDIEIGRRVGNEIIKEIKKGKQRREKRKVHGCEYVEFVHMFET